LLLSAAHSDSAGLVVSINGGVAACAVFGYLAILGPARRFPEAVLFVILVVVDLATAVLATRVPELGPTVAGYLILLPMVVALVLPWATWIHGTWLAVHAGLALLALATAVSQFGHLASLRARVLSFLQIQRISALHRQANRDQLRLDRLNRLLEQSATTDELTALRNRLALAADFRVVRSRIERQSDRYGVLVLDLDQFKAINDSLGHVAGDGVLRQVADAIASVLRPGDRAYRYGGEEFVVISRLKRRDEARIAGERVRDAVERLQLPNPGNPPYGVVTVSVGIASIGRADLAADDDAWVSRADAALYEAKARGRNRCEVSR
jgi:diguanylate cyclase (GGDEF)-like protein